MCDCCEDCNESLSATGGWTSVQLLALLGALRSVGCFSTVSEGLCCVSRPTYLLLPVALLLVLPSALIFSINFISGATQLLLVN